ncbi:MAG: eL32 family ribosomal protein [Nanoarchaeota archaeon]
MNKPNPKTKKKPKFIRQRAHNLKKLEKKWRAPKGMHSKLRKKFKGKAKQPSVGYSSPKKIRNLRQGLIPILISTESQLKNLTKEHGLIISRKLGAKKKVELLQKIKELKLNVLNVKDIDKFIKDVEEKLKQRKEAKQKKDIKKKKTEQEAATNQVKKKEETEEEKEKREKEEKRKVLEQK